MALPKLDTPTYEMTLPSTGKPVEFRPFLVKEEKLLLMALTEGATEADVLRAVKQVITNCVISKDFNVGEITGYDIEKIFLELRSKSVGETITLNFRHMQGKNRQGKECATVTPVDIDINEIELKWKKKVDPKISLTDNIGIKVKHPSVDIISEIAADKDKNEVNRIMALLRKCTEYIWDESEIHKVEDATDKELSAFFDTLTSEQFRKIEDFFQAVPKLEHTVTYQCKGCGEETQHTLKGLNDFFVQGSAMRAQKTCFRLTLL